MIRAERRAGEGNPKWSHLSEEVRQVDCWSATHTHSHTRSSFNLYTSAKPSLMQRPAWTTAARKIHTKYRKWTKHAVNYGSLQCEYSISRTTGFHCHCNQHVNWLDTEAEITEQAQISEIVPLPCHLSYEDVTYAAMVRIMRQAYFHRSLITSAITITVTSYRPSIGVSGWDSPFA